MEMRRTECAFQKSSKALWLWFEGVSRQATLYKNRNRDTAWFGIIDKDWRILKKSFQTWLKSDNFDIQGRQKKSLEQIRGNLH